MNDFNLFAQEKASRGFYANAWRVAVVVEFLVLLFLVAGVSP